MPLLQRTTKALCRRIRKAGTNTSAGALINATATVNALVTSVDDRNENAPETYVLAQNFPNPFNPETMIKYHLPKDSEVKLSIYNIFGQLVRTLVDKKQEAGFQSVEWDSQNEFGVPVASGVYIYRLEADHFVQTKKMLLLK